MNNKSYMNLLVYFLGFFKEINLEGIYKTSPSWISLVSLLLTEPPRASQSLTEPPRTSQGLPESPRASQSSPEIPKPFQSSQTATKAKTLKKPRKTIKTIDLTNDHSKNIEKTKKNNKNHRFQQLSQPRTLDVTPIVYEISCFFGFSWFFQCFCIGSF